MVRDCPSGRFIEKAQHEKRDQADLEGRLEIYRRLKSKKIEYGLDHFLTFLSLIPCLHNK